MITESQEDRDYSNPLSVVLGTLIGGLAGALIMLLLAPKSGKETRHQIREKSIDLHDRTSEIVEEATAQIRSSAEKISLDGREKLNKLKHYSQKLAVEQLDHVSEAAEAGKKSIKKA